MGSGPWGDGGWGDGSWGGGVDAADLVGVDVLAIRENVIRVEFSKAVWLTNLLDAADASRIEKWAITANASTTGLTGDVARDVTVIAASLSTVDDGIAEEDVGRFVDLTLDRPMTPWPAEYAVSWSSIFSSDLESEASGAAAFQAVYRQVATPTLEQSRPSRDVANPQTAAAARTATGQALALGTFGVGDDGDYATDEGVINLKKRVTRRLVTKRGAFAHLPDYGVGVPYYAKQLATSERVSSLRADAEDQVMREPDVEKARVALVQDSRTPGLARLRVAIKSKAGPPVAFDVPLAWD